MPIRQTIRWNNLGVKSSKATQFTFQTYLCNASLNDLHGYSVLNVSSMPQLPYWCGSSELSHLGVLGQRLSGVAGDGKASLTAVTLRCLLTLEAKTWNHFFYCLKAEQPCCIAFNMANCFTLRFIESEQHSSSAPQNRFSTSWVTPGLQPPHPIISWHLSRLNVLKGILLCSFLRNKSH